MKDGELVELGTHDELLARHGVYAELHGIQNPGEVTIGGVSPVAAHSQ